MSEPRTIVVGGGLAGLTAAATLARGGHAVTVLEGAEHAGGRARSRNKDGFDINIGPHALYRAGGGLAVLKRLGLRPSGHIPRAHRAGVWRSGEIVPALGEWRRTVNHRASWVRAASGLRPASAGELAGTPADVWIERVTRGDEAGIAFLASLLRTATYTGDHSLLDAGSAARHLRVAMQSVLYLDGGWSTLVDGLVGIIRAAGGDVRPRSTVEAVEYDEAGVRSVRLANGTAMSAHAAVIAVNDPPKLLRVLDGPLPLSIPAAIADTVPVRMAHLDVALRPLPTRRFPNVFGLDEPLFISVPSDVANVAPATAGVVNVGRYLRPGEEALDHRPSIERILDSCQPAWRDHVVDVRYTPRSMVSADHVRSATRGSLDRLTVDAVGVPGVTIAGDWIGPVGMLADASILSGAAAARSVIGALTRMPASAMA